MGCETFDLGDGAFAIVCSRGRKARKPCSVCGRQPHSKLCDFKLTGAKAGKTCDLEMCSSCAKHVGPDRDLCPAHAKLEHTQGVLALEPRKP